MSGHPTWIDTKRIRANAVDFDSATVGALTVQTLRGPLADRVAALEARLERLGQLESQVQSSVQRVDASMSAAAGLMAQLKGFDRPDPPRPTVIDLAGGRAMLPAGHAMLHLTLACRAPQLEPMLLRARFRLNVFLGDALLFTSDFTRDGMYIATANDLIWDHHVNYSVAVPRGELRAEVQRIADSDFIPVVDVRGFALVLPSTA